MNGLQRTLTLLVATVGLAACGGGGGPSTAVPVATALTGTGGTSQTPVATATLTIRGALGFHSAKGLSKTSASQRKPAYVNSNANYLDVWVITNGTPVHVVNSVGGSNINVQNGGIQTLSIPLYSASAVNYIIAYESDQPFGTPGNLLAVGEDDVSISAGSAPQVSLTMLMNTAYIGIMDNADDSDTSAVLAYATSPGAPFIVNCCNGSADVFFFAADPDAGFVDLAGVGGVSQPLVTNASPSGILSQTGVNAGYVYYQCGSNLLTVNLTAANPAYAIAQSAITSSYLFPGATLLYQASVDSDFTSYMQNTYGVIGPTVSGQAYISNSGC